MSPETPIRLTIAISILLALLICERLFPRRPAQHRKTRWPPNLAIGLLNAVLLLLAPLSAVGASLFALFNQFGLCVWLRLPLWHGIILSLLLLDLAIYWQHRLLHAIPPLWRIHRMHHTDTELDVTTALRFHPLEILLSLLLKAALIVLLGAPLLAVIAFEILLNGIAMFNHANLRLPPLADAVLRFVWVTPDMHRIHHSVRRREHDTNYGFNLSVWDRLFRSYTRHPRDSHAAMRLGQPDFRAPRESRLLNLLTQPFR
ncbi:MAG: sterol desaturase family protein [Gammaproteobacteria bacterium]